MNESLLNDETLTTADIARPATKAPDRPPMDRDGELGYRREPAAMDRDHEPMYQREPAETNSRRSMEDGTEARPIALPANTPDGATSAESNTETTALFPEDELNSFRARWKEVQTSFVDEPRHAVEHADSLVANVVKRIAEQFAAERATLEEQWGKGDNVSTEDLRQSLKRYRSLFDRLLSF